LEREEDLRVVAEAGNGEDAVRLAAETRPDIALVDIAMPRLNGIEATKRIKELSPATAVLILTAYDDDQYVFALLEAGAAGYLLKNVRGHCLVEAIRAVNAGESALHPAIARKVIDRFARAPKESPLRADTLEPTDRELEVLRLAAKGLSNKEIADRLCLSARTIQAHLGALFTKMDVGSRTEAVVQALRKDWLTLDDIQ
jgi:DNA-binding NarL/FixJ family response regulator